MHRRAPTSAITISLVAELRLSPRRLTRADTTTASARRAASTTFFDRAVDLVERAPIVPSCAACAVRTHRRAPTNAITTSFVAALTIAAPAHLSRHDHGKRAPSRE